MEDHKKIYTKGIEYFHNAISFSKSNKFGETITLNVIGLSAEYLLSAVLFSNGINYFGTGLQSIVSTLESNNLMPADIKEETDKLCKQCACSGTNNSQMLNMTELTDALRTIKQWVEAELKLALAV